MQINAKVIGILLLLIALWVVMIVAVPENFLKPNNIENLLRRTAFFGILGIGVCFVIITAGIDLSIGSIVCLSGGLLTIFLKVDYQPFDVERIVAVRGADKKIVLRAGVESFKAGDRIRYYGGTRVRNAMLEVERVETADHSLGDGVYRNATILHVDKPLSGNDTSGKVAKIFAVTSFNGGDPKADPPRPPTVGIAGAHSHIAPRDTITLVHPKSGLDNLRVTAAEVGDQGTVLTLNQKNSDITNEWVAIPFERRQRMPILGGVGLVLLIGLGLGCVHGLLVTKLHLQPFVVTLCGLLIYRGIARWMMDDQVGGFGDEYNHSLSRLAEGKLVLGSFGGEPFGIPVPFFILVFVAIVAAIFLNMTIWGRYMRALGRNEEAAVYSGINTHRMTILAYVICTVLACTGGMLFALDSNSVSPSAFGNFYELYAIAAAVLGGCSLRGGEGGILGVVIGTAVMQTLYNLIQLLRIPDTLEFVIIGMVILAGVIADEVLKRVVARRRAVLQAKSDSE